MALGKCQVKVNQRHIKAATSDIQVFFTGSEILFGNGGSIHSNEWKMSKIIEVAAAFSGCRDNKHLKKQSILISNNILLMLSFLLQQPKNWVCRCVILHRQPRNSAFDVKQCVSRMVYGGYLVWWIYQLYEGQITFHIQKWLVVVLKKLTLFHEIV